MSLFARFRPGPDRRQGWDHDRWGEPPHGWDRRRENWDHQQWGRPPWMVPWWARWRRRW